MTENKKCSIYMLTNKINGKKYIGSTIVEVNKRYNQHIYNATHPEAHQYNYPLYQAIRKYGLENFSFEVLLTIECEEEQIRQLEKDFIIIHNSLSPNGYNQTLDTQHPLQSLESIKKMSETKREKAKQVAEITNDNKIIKIWRSIIDCAEELKCSEKKIAACCRGERKTTSSKRFCWIDEEGQLLIPEYHKETYKGELGTTQNQISNRKVAKIDLKTHKQIKLYDSIALAARENNCDASGISKVCRGKRKSCGGFIWQYIDF